jgi:hypothetical protein
MTLAKLVKKYFTVIKKHIFVKHAHNLFQKIQLKFTKNVLIARKGNF